LLPMALCSTGRPLILSGQWTRPRERIMPLLERDKKIVEIITGLERPSSGELYRQVRSRKANAFFFRDDGIIPNHPRWALVPLPTEFDPAAIFEDLFARNGWQRLLAKRHLHYVPCGGASLGDGRVFRGRCAKPCGGDVVLRSNLFGPYSADCARGCRNGDTNRRSRTRAISLVDGSTPPARCRPFEGYG
jgi:hypothetical protein